MRRPPKTIDKLEIEYIKIENLKPYEKNARKHQKEDVDTIKASIKEFGMCDPIGIWGEKNIIVEGHGRLMALKELGYEEVPCIRLDFLSDEQRRAYALAHNKTAEMSNWDFDLLDSELDNILDIDMTNFGFEIEEEEPEEPEVTEDDYEVLVPEEPKAKLGDIYQLGGHRLMCGDSTKAEDVARLMDGDFADLVVTDPPYNVAIENSKGMNIENDDMESGRFKDFLTDCFVNLKRSLKAGGAFYVWYAFREHINFEQALNEAGLKMREQLIWNKNTFSLGRDDYHWKHEPCLYGWKDGEKHFFIDDRTQSTVFEDKGIDIKKLKKEKMAELLKEFLSDRCSTTIINEDKPSVNDLHPTMKPIKLIARLVKNSSRQDEIVLDLFGGSGSTLITCEQLNRSCRMMEYDPKYVDVIIDRWEQFTGEKAVKLNEE